MKCITQCAADLETQVWSMKMPDGRKRTKEEKEEEE